MKTYLDILSCFKDFPVVYIDETGIDTYLFRKKARAKRGVQVYDKVSGRRFERTSLVAGQVGQNIIAPMIYKGTMTTDFFTKWYEEQLLPSLEEPHVIVMDNATFHSKMKLDELSIAQGHYFLPLPPYSPELNPIEQYWANLKAAVTELLRTFPSVEECLVYYLKTK